MVKKVVKRNYERKLERALRSFIKKEGYIDTWYLHDSIRWNIKEKGDNGLPQITVFAADYIKYHPILKPFLNSPAYIKIVEEYTFELFRYRIESSLAKF